MAHIGDEVLSQYEYTDNKNRRNMNRNKMNMKDVEIANNHIVRLDRSRPTR